MKKFLVLFFILCYSVIAFAADVEVWQDPSLNFSEIKKIFILPINPKLEAGTQLMPPKQLNAQIISWITDGINSSMKRNRPVIKELDAVIEDMKFIYGDKIPEGQDFYKKAKEMGYDAFISADLRQVFALQHVPEQVRTYTEYKDIEKRDRNGKIIETIRIPQEKTEIIPAHNINYLSTNFNPKLFLTDNPEGDYVAAAKGSIYREYQGGPVIKVVENLVKASMKNLFAHEEKKNSKSKRRK